MPVFIYKLRRHTLQLIGKSVFTGNVKALFQRRRYHLTMLLPVFPKIRAARVLAAAGIGNIEYISEFGLVAAGIHKGDALAASPHIAAHLLIPTVVSRAGRGFRALGENHELLVVGVLIQPCGGGRKIYRQKGTGNARHHGNRAPQFRHGGVVFAPKPRDYVIAVPKKVRRLAFKSALTSKLNDGDIIVVDELTLSEGKTKLMANVLKKLGAEKKALVVLPEKDENVVRATANLPQAMTTYVNTLNVYDILNAGKVVLTKAAVASVEEVYA